MISPDRIAKVQQMHSKAVGAAQKWSEAAAKGRKTETLYARYEAAERAFDRAVAMLNNR